MALLANFRHRAITDKFWLQLLSVVRRMEHKCLLISKSAGDSNHLVVSFYIPKGWRMGPSSEIVICSLGLCQSEHSFHSAHSTPRRQKADLVLRLTVWTSQCNLTVLFCILIGSEYRWKSFMVMCQTAREQSTAMKMIIILAWHGRWAIKVIWGFIAGGL